MNPIVLESQKEGVKSPKPRLVMVTPIIQATSLYCMHVPNTRSVRVSNYGKK